MASDWEYDVVSIGYPGRVMHGRPAADPPNLGKGWVGFNFEKAFGKPVRIINDAAMQALGGYRGGRTLFLGFGTGLGSVLILDNIIIPLELGDLPTSRKRALWELLGKRGLKRNGRKYWERLVHIVVEGLSRAFSTDTVIIGGGNARKLKRLPACARRVTNNHAFTGGARLWGMGSMRAWPAKHTWVIA